MAIRLNPISLKQAFRTEPSEPAKSVCGLRLPCHIGVDAIDPNSDKACCSISPPGSNDLHNEVRRSWATKKKFEQTLRVSAPDAQRNDEVACQVWQH
jgi:hypothetical protein